MAKLEATSVKLADGRVVKFGRGEKVVKEPIGTADDEQRGLRFVGRIGRVVEVIYTDYPANVQAYLLEYGVKQRLSDGYASVEETDECLDRIAELDERFLAGVIAGEREAPTVDRDLVAAIQELYGKEPDEAKDFVRGLKPAERDGFRQVEEIKAVIDRLATERAEPARLSGWP